MKNMKKFLALSLLLSIPSMQYAMENNIGQQVGESMASNTMEIGKSVTNSGADAVGQVSENVANQVTENAVNQSWFSNPWNWSRPSMSDLGLQDRLSNFNESYVTPTMQSLNENLQKGSTYLQENVMTPMSNTASNMMTNAGTQLNSVKEGYIDPAIENVSAKLQGAGTYLQENVMTPTSDTVVSTYETYGAPVVQKAAAGLQVAADKVGNYFSDGIAGLQTSGNYVHESALKPGYALGLQGYEQSAKFLEDNPQVAGLGLLASAIGAWALYKYAHQTAENPAEQERVNQFMNDFMTENAVEIEQIQAKIQAEEQARLKQAEKAGNKTWYDVVGSLSPWGSATAAIETAPIASELTQESDGGSAETTSVTTAPVAIVVAANTTTETTETE